MAEPEPMVPMKIEGSIEFSITERTPERVSAEMPVRPGMLNPYGIVNAGAMVWFADVCASVLVNGERAFSPGAVGFPLGVSLNADFSGNLRDGVLFATSTYVRRGRRLNVVHTVITGDGGHGLATVTTKHLAAR